PRREKVRLGAEGDRLIRPKQSEAQNNLSCARDAGLFVQNFSRSLNMKLRNKLLSAAMIFSAPFLAHAESTFTSAGSNTTAHLDFQITIPRILFLQVGTGTALANNTGINLITFTVPAANVGDGTVINASATSGDIGNGTVTARVIGNNG